MNLKSNLFHIIEGQAHFSTSWHAKTSLTPNEMECSLFKPSQCLHACTKNSPNMEGVVCKTTNSNQKYAELNDNSVVVFNFMSTCFSLESGI